MKRNTYISNYTLGTIISGLGLVVGNVGSYNQGYRTSFFTAYEGDEIFLRYVGMRLHVRNLVSVLKSPSSLSHKLYAS
jgi:hypothetical protein